jgi:hypothetical protein
MTPAPLDHPPRLAIPTELRTTVGRPIGVAVVYDLDYLSHAGPGGDRVDDATLASLTEMVEASASAFGTLSYVRAACSTATASAYRLTLAGAANNRWQAVKGRHGADACVVAELNHLATILRMRLVVLVGGEHAYVAPVLALRAVGVAVWVLYRPGSLSWRLYQAATSATPLPIATAVAAHPGKRRSQVAALLVEQPGGIRA